MTQYVVQPGDSPAKVAGQVYGDQRRYIDLINANGGNWQPGQVIDIPDITGTPSPVITQAQWAATQTGFSNGKPTYVGGATNTSQSRPAGPAPTQFGGPATPNFGSAGAYDSRTGGDRGTSPWGVQPPPAQPHPTYGANSAGTYDKRTGRNAGVTGAGPGAMPTTRGAGYNANPNTWNMPGASARAPGSRIGPMGNGAGPVSGQPPYSGNGPNPLLYSTTNPAAGDPLLQAAQKTASSVFKPSTPTNTGNNPGNPNAPGYNVPAPQVTPMPHSTVPPEMANIVWAARYSAEAIAAYGGLYGPAWKGNRNALPVVIYPTVANEIPIPKGYGSTAEFMAALGYEVDTSGNYVLKKQAVSQGYGGGGGYSTQTRVSSPYTPYGGYGGYGYGGGGASGSHTAIPNGTPMGLVAWRVNA